jgi:hypothetical protein
MRTFLRYFLILAATSGGFFLTWWFTQPELVGHWHVVESLGTDGNGMQGIYHFNVYATGEIRVNETNEGEYVLPGYVDKMSKQIHFGGECWYVGTDYRVWGSRMELSSRNDRDPWHAVAHRTKEGDCDLERDYFVGLPLELRLPELPTAKLEPLPDLYKTYCFYLGADKITRKDRLMFHRSREIMGKSDLDEMVDRYTARAPVLGYSPDQIILFQDKSDEGEASLELLKDKFGGELGFTGYYRVYRAPDGEEALSLGMRWVGF